AFPDFGPFGHDRGFGNASFFGAGYDAESLAEALGISVDELKAAYQEARQSGLDQAVEAGLITQAQADAISAGNFPSGDFPFGGRWMGWLSQNGIDFEALLAKALGIGVDDLRAAQTEAIDARIDQAVADGKLTEEQAELMKGRHALFTSESFRTAMQSAFEAAVNRAVTEGIITQSQADLILENRDGAGFPGFGGLGGRPGRHGGFGWGGGS
ncbi:MAG TPA: hypothetical protein VJ436_02870, partial [Anaerolineales bacterium]|nr:hypothetical protein [Anaerolineales bacterium]